MSSRIVVGYTATDAGLVISPDGAHNQIEGTFALANPALADDQHAQPQDIHEHPVDDLANREGIIEQGADPRDRHRRGDRCAQ